MNPLRQIGRTLHYIYWGQWYRKRYAVAQWVVSCRVLVRRGLMTPWYGGLGGYQLTRRGRALAGRLVANEVP